MPKDLASMLATLGNNDRNLVAATRPALSSKNARSALFLGYAENP